MDLAHRFRVQLVTSHFDLRLTMACQRVVKMFQHSQLHPS